MKFVRFYKHSEGKSNAQYGILESQAEGKPRVQGIRGDPIHGYQETDRGWLLEEVVLLSPVQASKIVAVGVNYASHAEEFQKEPPPEPLLFLKPSSAIIGPGERIRTPGVSRRVDYEAELAVIMGRTAKSIQPQEAPQYILGYTCFNDVTARDLQKRDGQWTRAKGFDTFAPMGPCIATGLDPRDLNIQCRLNGQLKQSASTAEMIFDVYALISYISNVMTLLPGDVVTTGTPSGVGPMQPGDEIEVSIDGIGSLRNSVA